MTDTLEHTNGKVTSVREPKTYSPTSRHSFFVDLARAQVLHDARAEQRLGRHTLEMRVDTGTEERTAPNTTTGTGGEFAPPAYLIDQFRTAARAGRPLGDLVNNLPLPAGVTQLNIPKLSTTVVSGVDTAIQAVQGEPVASVDETTSYLTSNVVTIAGEWNVSQQLYDLTPTPGFDQVAYLSLTRDYNAALEVQLVAGSGSGGQLKGLTNFAPPSTNQVDGTSVGQAMTSAYAMWELFGQAFANLANNRGLPPEVCLMSGRRWGWLGANVDAQQRPLMTPGQSAPTTGDIHPVIVGGSPAYGPIQGVPVYLDNACLVNGTTGTEFVFFLRASDMFLWESDDKYRAVVNPTSGTLQVKLQLRKYVAFIGNAYSSSTAWVNNLKQPTNF